MHLGKSLNPGGQMLLESKGELLFQSGCCQLPDAHILMLLESKGALLLQSEDCQLPQVHILPHLREKSFCFSHTLIGRS